MTLKDISVKKFIGLYDIINSNFYADEIDREIALLVCLTGKPEDYYLNMPLTDFKECSKSIEFINVKTIKPEPKRFIKANGKTYAPLYDFSKLTAAQFIDASFFLKEADKIIDNLPKILASMCVPTKKTFTGRKVLSYVSNKHKEVAEDMENASILDAYSIAVFFWDVWKTFLESTGDCMILKILEAKKKTGEPITKKEQEILLSILQVFGDGITTQKK